MNCSAPCELLVASPSVNVLLSAHVPPMLIDPLESTLTAAPNVAALSICSDVTLTVSGREVIRLLTVDAVPVSTTVPAPPPSVTSSALVGSRLFDQLFALFHETASPPPSHVIAASSRRRSNGSHRPPNRWRKLLPRPTLRVPRCITNPHIPNNPQ